MRDERNDRPLYDRPFSFLTPPRSVHSPVGSVSFRHLSPPILLRNGPGGARDEEEEDGSE